MTEEKSKLLILYSTVDGHTKHICEYISEKLNKDKEIIISSLDEIIESVSKFLFN